MAHNGSKTLNKNMILLNYGYKKEVKSMTNRVFCLYSGEGEGEEFKRSNKKTAKQ
jgi:hypothetical protein